MGARPFLCPIQKVRPRINTNRTVQCAGHVDGDFIIIYHIVSGHIATHYLLL